METSGTETNRSERVLTKLLHTWLSDTWELFYLVEMGHNMPFKLQLDN